MINDSVPVSLRASNYLILIDGIPRLALKPQGIRSCALIGYLGSIYQRFCLDACL